MIKLFVVAGPLPVWQGILLSFYGAFWGAIYGYAVGTLVSGVFLVADAIRTAMQKWKGGP